LQNRIIRGLSPIVLSEIKETTDLAVLRIKKEPAILNTFDRKERTSLDLGEKIETWFFLQKIHQS